VYEALRVHIAVEPEQLVEKFVVRESGVAGRELCDFEERSAAQLAAQVLAAGARERAEVRRLGCEIEGYVGECLARYDHEAATAAGFAQSSRAFVVLVAEQR
jgi:hypothetical protein